MSAFTNFLGNVFTSKTNVKDYSHASRLYVEDYFKLAPKAGFLYYVVFNINRNNNPIIQQFIQKNGPELGLLVKAADLPKFKMATETMNQYNKKTIVQSKIDYQPINFTFHDDHNNTTTGLWKSYYNYYFVDGLNVRGTDIPLSYSNVKNGTKWNKAGATVSETTNYGLNNGQQDPFFTSIEIYQLNRHQFTSFILVNPIITDWGHDQVDQSQSKMLENKMTIQYESVLYGTGFVKLDAPAGFAKIHYDTVPGPLSIFGGGNSSILGAGGIIPGINELFGGAGDTSPLGLLKTVKGAKNLLGNVKNVTKSSLLQEGFGILNKVATTGKLPDVLTGTSPSGLSLATLPGEQPTTTLSSSMFGGKGFDISSTLGNVAAGFNQLTSGLGNTLKGLLPSSLPRTPGGLSALKAEQEDLAASISNQIAANQTVQDEIMPLIAAAQSVGDLDTIDSLYSQLDAVGYTDPSKLTEHLNSINQNIQTIDGLLTTAVAAETPSNTLNVDTVDLGVSPDNVYNVTDNPDLQTQTSIVYRDNNGTIPQYYA
jgi:hypothetical protein